MELGSIIQMCSVKDQIATILYFKATFSQLLSSPPSSSFSFCFSKLFKWKLNVTFKYFHNIIYNIANIILSLWDTQEQSVGRFGQGPGFPGRWSEAQRIHKHEEAFPCSSGSHQGFKPHVVWGFGIFLCPSPSSPFHPTLVATTRNPSPVEFSPSLPSPLLLALLLWPLGPEKSSASFFFPSPLLLAPERVVRLSIIHSVPPGFRWDFLGGATWLLLIPQAEYLLDNPLWATNDSLFV